MRCAIVGSATRNARAISSVVSPPSRRSVSATLRLGRQHGMTRREDQAQEVVADVIVQRGVEGVGLAGLLRVDFVAQLRVLTVEKLPPAKLVDGAVLGGCHQPGARVVRNARRRPALQCGHQRVLRQIFGEPDVPHHARQPGNESRRLDAPDRVDRLMAVGRAHGGRSDHLRRPHATCRQRPPQDRRADACISWNPAAASWTSAGKSPNSCTCRTSMTSFSDAGQREAHSIASARDLTWIIQ